MHRALQLPVRLLVLVLGTAASVVSAASEQDESGTYPIVQYTMRDYQAHNQIWCAVQDERGRLYFGNRGYVLEFDGENWRKLSVPNGSFIRAMALDPRGRIWIGGSEGEFGYLEPGGPEGMAWVSIRERLPALETPPGDFRSVHVTEDGVFFATDRAVLRWRDGGLRVWERNSELPIRLRLLGGALWLFERGTGISRLEGDDWQIASTDEFFRLEDVQGAIEEPDGAWLITTRDGELFRVRDLVAQRVPTVVDGLLTEANLRGIARLDDGAIALPTVDRGTILLAPDGSVEAIFDQDSGLLSQFHRSPFVDRDGGLWLLTNNGIAHVQRGPFTLFDRRRGLPPTYIHHVIRQDGRIVIGTDGGLFALESNDVLHGGARLRKLTTSPADTVAMCGHPSGLLFSNPFTVFRLGPDDAIEPAFTPPDRVGALHLSPLRDDLLFVSMGSGLGIARLRNGTWQFAGTIPQIQRDARDVVQLEDGTVWFENGGMGVGRVNFSPDSDFDPARASVTFFNSEHGLPEGPGWAAPHRTRGGELFVSTVFGLHTFSEASGRFARFSGYGTHLAGDTVLVDRIVEDSTGTAWASVSASDESESPWGRGTFGRSVLEEDGNRRWEILPTRLFAPTHALSAVTVDEAPGHRLLWVGTQDGLLRIDLDRLGRQAQLPDTCISAVTTTAGRPVFGGFAPAGDSRPALDYADRNLRFSYGAPSFPPGRSVLYQTRLEGFDNTWSAPTRRSVREVNNLTEGGYRFLVRTVDVDGRVGKVASYALQIRPPWMRSLAAFGTYGIAFALGVAGLVRWRGAALRRRNEQLELTVAERTAELLVARDEADRANRAKSTFLANMSHELRTPLNGILGYTQILKRSPTIQPIDRQRIDVLHGSGEHLLRLINEVLDLSKIEAGKLELHPVACDVRALAKAVAETLRPRIEEKGLAFVLNLDVSLPACVLLDEQKLGQVLFNLLGNALKFTAAGSVELRLSAVSADGGATRLLFEVVDTGAGIAPAEQAAIFEPFHQITDNAKHPDGTGLGLAICARIVGLMGGRLQLESTVGRGSRFWFEVPATSANEATPAATLSAGTAVTGYDGPRRRVLVVDDVPVNRDVLREMLAPLGFVVDAAAGGVAALASIAGARPDLVLMDLRMAPMSGKETVQRLRGEASTRELKIVAFSASTIGFTRADALQLGCDDFLSKPFREQELLAILERHLGLQWQRATGIETIPAAHGFERPTARQAADLLVPARSGDTAALREAIENMVATNPGLRGFAAEIDGLVERFQMQEIRHRLERLMRNGH